MAVSGATGMRVDQTTGTKDPGAASDTTIVRSSGLPAATVPDLNNSRFEAGHTSRFGWMLKPTSPPQRTAPTAPADIAARPTTRTPGQGGVLFVGDSHTIALSNAFSQIPHDGGKVSTTYQNGSSLDMWARGGSLSGKLDKALESKPDVVVISLGTNDGIAKKPPEQIRAQVLDIVDRARAKGSKVIFALPLHTTRETAGVNAARSTLADTLRSRPDVDVIDVSGENIRLRDGIHAHMPEKGDAYNGYTTWAQFIYDHADAAARTALQKAGERNKR